MMSKQRDILPDVLSFVQEQVPNCPVYLGGSVSRRHERPDSDIDLFVVVADVDAADVPGGKVEWQEHSFKLVAATFHEVPIHLHVGSPALLQMFEKHPWRAYKFLQMERLHDPDGIVQRAMDRVAPWFDEHPDAAELWQQWLEEHRERQLSGGSQLGSLLKQFPSQVPDLWSHLDDMYGDKVAEPGTEDDAKNRTAHP